MSQTNAQTETLNKPDLDCPEAIQRMVRLFYDGLLGDPLMRPVFLENAGVDLDHHLPTIEAYWRKMLLGEQGVYTRNMVQKHQAVHERSPLRDEHFRRWGWHFHATLDAHFEGPLTRRAHQIADRILANLQNWLNVPSAPGSAPDDPKAPES